SRRRHTRFSRDWSSDVCSSDLSTARHSGRLGSRPPRPRPTRRRPSAPSPAPTPWPTPPSSPSASPTRRRPAARRACPSSPRSKTSPSRATTPPRSAARRSCTGTPPPAASTSTSRSPRSAAPGPDYLTMQHEHSHAVPVAQPDTARPEAPAIRREEVFDAIVVGSGITGGWAAKELTERGLRTLVLERGRPITHGESYVTEHVPPWQMPFRGRGDRTRYEREQPMQSQIGPFNEYTAHWYINDRENPYTTGRDHVLW